MRPSRRARAFPFSFETPGLSARLLRKTEMVNIVSDIELKKQENYETAIRLGWDSLEGEDFAERASKAGARWDPEGGFLTVRMVGRTLQVHPAGREITAPRDHRPVREWEKIILLHYLKLASGAPPTGKLITYKEIPDGMMYWPNFVARVHKILISAFGSEPEKLLELAPHVDGEPYDNGDAALNVKALPHVNLIITIWKGDDELPPEAAVLLDSSITDYLPAEDITVLCQMLAIKLMRATR